ncbi:MAG: 2-C-methyl-D-erythritol 2,4-cyclodiphosphate synthase [Planctomycetes bacterium]|nr:2-C-methyl-D-erythritol 2,4-cyclodiphosphate synthase [Planctomycetota bacterium]
MDYRIGYGSDLHRLSDGKKLTVGGIAIPSALGCVAHSDGDVLLHALTDAILGALGEGDIGELFPDTDPRNAGRDSADFVREAVRRMQTVGFEINNLDTIINAEAPKFSPYKPAIRDSLATLCGCDPSQVNIKAKTAEGVGPIGRGETISAEVTVLLKRV